MDILKERFNHNIHLHEGITWDYINEILDKNPQIVKAISKMEESGGEPDFIVYNGNLFVCDCVKETPLLRRKVCFDKEARLSRKKNAPKTSVMEEVKKMGVSLMSEEIYRYLQTLDEYDMKTSSWIDTPSRIREKGGALFCERRYDEVFTFHNGADSYYSTRGFRTMLKITT